jgi:signal transduction histidine kinase
MMLFSVDLAIRLINDLLFFQRVQSGKFEFKCRWQKRDEFFGLIQSYFDRRVKSKTLKPVVSFDLKEVPAYLFLDADRLTQIISNLTDNSVKFTPPGNATVVDPAGFVSSNDLFIDQGGVVELTCRLRSVSQFAESACQKDFDAQEKIEGMQNFVLSFSVSDTGIGISVD